MRALNYDRTSAIAIVAIVATLSLFYNLSSAQESNSGVILNFRDVDIRTLTEKISELTGKTVLLDNRVRGAITVVSAMPVAHDMVFDIFLAALRLNGFVSIETDEGLTILPASDAKNATPLPGFEVELRPQNEIVTILLPVTHVDINQMSALLKPYISKEALLSTIPDQTGLLLTDFADSAQAIKTLLTKLDRPVIGSITIIDLFTISPQTLIDYFEKLYVTGSTTSKDKGGNSQFSLVPDSRANRLIIRSNDPMVIKRLQDIALLLDYQPKEQKKIHVVALSFANAKEVAAVISESLALFTSQVKGEKYAALANESTKTVVVHAPTHIFKQIVPIIEFLDAERRQIYVEALIVEIQTSQIAEFGVQWQSLRGMDPNRASGPTNVGSVAVGPQGGKISEAGSGNWPGGASIGVVSGVITMPDGTVIPNILALASALATKTQANILSTPTLMALDNEEAEIIVAQNVPIITGSYAPPDGGGVSPFQTIERRDIGLSLKIKPQISPFGAIKLDIYQEVSSLLPTTVQTGAADVVTNKRSLETTVIIRDRQMIVLGGLIQEDVSVSEDKVPILGDIPILGHLFRYENRKRIKTNLLIFLQPRLISSASEASALALNGYRYIQGEQGDLKVYDNIMFPDVEWPSLPNELLSGQKEDEPSERAPHKLKESTTKNTDLFDFDDDF